MKVIFLDIDGVLNWRATVDRISGYIGFCPARIARLNRITAAVPDAKIVVSSTWRHCFDTDAYRDFPGLVALLKKRGVSAEIIDKTPHRFSYLPRGGEIREWIRAWKAENPGQKLEIVVLDDDTAGMLAHGDDDLRPFHVVTSFDGQWDFRAGAETLLEEGGLLDKHVDQAIKVLGGHRIPAEERGQPDADRWETVEQLEDEKP